VNEPKRGSWDWLIVQYIKGPDFKRIKSQSFRRNLSRQFDRFRVEFGDCTVTDLRPYHVEEIIGRMAETPAAANERLKLIKRLCRFAMKREYIASDPTFGIKRLPMNPDGYYTWTDADIAQFEAYHGIDSKAVLAMRLMLYTGAARQDAAAMGWQNIKSGRIEYRRIKTGGQVSLRLELMPKLIEVLGMVPREALLFVTHSNGLRYTPESFGNWFGVQCNKAGLQKCSAHGLRKAGATEIANNGGTEFEIMAFLGHRTPDEARTYVKAADRHKLADAGMEKRLNVSNPVVRLDKSKG
jgi:integrase